MPTNLLIDGAEGEGGGQIIRSALTLAMISGTSFEVINIRAGRKTPGLLKQHLTAVNAAREICGGGVTGAELGSRQLIFAPGSIQRRDFSFSIGSAGSTTLVAQTLIPALMLGTIKSSIEIEGGTHNQAAPPFDYLHNVYLPLLSRMGPTFQSEISSWGFYPAGGGRIRIEINPANRLAGIELLETGAAPIGHVTAVVSRLSLGIAERETELIRRRAGWKLKQCEVRKVDHSPGPGNVVMIRLTSPNVTELFSAFGKLGRSAEEVALDAWKQAREYLLDQVPVGEHLCDQLLVPLALAASTCNASRFRTGVLSRHSETQISLIPRFLPVRITVMEEDQRRRLVTVEPN